jgi:hypothetical protein
MKTPDTEFDSGHSEFQEEWLSAYLDEELTADQRAIVEQRLDSDPAARQLLDDLQRIRGLVVQLPTWPFGGKPLSVAELENAALEELDDCPVASGLEASPPGSVLALDAETIEPSLHSPESEQSEGHFQVQHLSRSDWSRWKPLAIAAGTLAMVGVGFSMWRAQFYAQPLADAGRAAPTSRSMEVAQADSRTFDDDSVLSDDSRGLEQVTMFDRLSTNEAASASLAEEVVSMPAIESRLADSPASMAAPLEPNSRGDGLGALSPPESLGIARADEKPALREAGESLALRFPPAAASSQTASMPATGAFKQAGELNQNLAPARGGLAEPSPRPESAPVVENQSLLVARGEAWSDQDFEFAMASVASSLNVSSSNADVRPNAGRQRNSVQLIGGGFPLAIATIHSERDPADSLASLLESNLAVDWFVAPQTNPDYESGGRLPLSRNVPADSAALPLAAPDDSRSENKRMVEGEYELTQLALSELKEKLQGGPSASASSIALFLRRSQAEQVLREVKARGMTTTSPLWITLASPEAASGTPNEKVILILHVE